MSVTSMSCPFQLAGQPRSHWLPQGFSKSALFYTSFLAEYTQPHLCHHQSNQQLQAVLSQ